MYDLLLIQDHGEEIVKHVSIDSEDPTWSGESLVACLTILLVQVSYITENSYSCTNIVKLVSTSIVLN